ncbi:MAG: nucleotidyltransferase family protein [Gammaproteobacteria bacterium]|nr:nucleotidyltransferase family protein [Gammaproteobacteria bacterium]
MHAMILAAGLGTRMRPLTEELPKPLLPVGGKPLIQYLIEALARAGIGRIVINHGPRGERIETAIGDGSGFGVEILYSAEGPTPLETGGGISRALPLLGPEPFIVANGDIWTDFDFATLPSNPVGLAHLVLVDNPPHHRAGDFALSGRQVREKGEQLLTYTGIGVFRPDLFANCPKGPFPLAPVLRLAMQRDAVTGECFAGRWIDVGSLERLRELDLSLRQADS